MKESYSMKIFPTYNLFQNTSKENSPISYELNNQHSPYKSPKKESKQHFQTQETSSLFPIQENAYNENPSSNNEIFHNSVNSPQIINTIYSSHQPFKIQKKYIQRNKNSQNTTNKPLFNSYFNGNVTYLQKNPSTVNINKLTLNKINYLDDAKNKPIKEEYSLQNEKVTTPKKKNKIIFLKNLSQVPNNMFLSPDVNRYTSRFNNIFNNNENYNNESYNNINAINRNIGYDKGNDNAEKNND